MFRLEVTDFHDFGLKWLVLPRTNQQCQILWKNLTFEMKVAKGRLPLKNNSMEYTKIIVNVEKVYQRGVLPSS